MPQLFFQASTSPGVAVGCGGAAGVGMCPLFSSGSHSASSPPELPGELRHRHFVHLVPQEADAKWDARIFIG